MYQLYLFILLLLVIQFESIVSQINPVPGIGWIGSSIHLLNGLDPFGSIIEHTYSGGKTSDQLFDISNHVIDVPHVQCSYTSIGLTAESYDEYQKKSTSSLKISGSYKAFSGAYSTTTESIKQNIYKNQQVVSLIAADCVQYELNLVGSGAPLKSWFVAEAQLLPDNIDTDANLQQYYNFFNYYGTHIVTGCEVGGKLYQYSFTDESYAQLNSKETTTQQAEATFFVSLDASTSATRSIDSQYTSITTTWNIQTIGGRWPATNDNWIPWIQSVQNLENVGCINWSARDITDVWHWSNELVSKQSVAIQALRSYFDVRGCTVPSALNYDRYALVDTNCQYGAIPEFRICFQEVEGSSQCQETRTSCSAWSSTASVEDIGTWTASFRDDTDNRGGGCKYQWKVEQRDSALTYEHHDPHKYRICFKELEGSSQCQGSRDTCSGWNNEEQWTNWFRDDTDGRGGGCNYRWMIDSIEDNFASEIKECRVCFQEIEGSSQCQGSRFTCTGWSKTSPRWSAAFRDDTDNRGGGCKYQWKLQCL